MARFETGHQEALTLQQEEKMASEKTLVDYMQVLSDKELDLLCSALSLTNDARFTNIHRGALPFVKLTDAIAALSNFHYGAGLTSRFAQKLLAKIGVNKKDKASVQFAMALSDKRVIKEFGPHPERGVKMKGRKIKVTVGVRWSLPRKCYEPDDNVLVSPTFALKAVGKNHWVVTVNKAYREEVQRYLMDTCMHYD